MVKLGVLCPSEVAFRRFMPALKNVSEFSYVGIAVNSPYERYGGEIPDKNVVEEMMRTEYGKAKMFVNDYGGKIYSSYESMIGDNEINAIYIPLPPGLHHYWAKKALNAGKHVLVEKPATTCISDSKELVELADSRRLALHENYMFSFHSQLDEIDKIIDSGELGDVRLYRISFGFPMRAHNDFRYQRSMGGGALLDAGGYTIKYASHLLGKTARVTYAHLNQKDGFDVDMYGSGALVNEEGVVAQVAFGMDNNYKCELEVWGSKACLTTGRVLTAPVGFNPTLIIRRNTEDEERTLSADDSFGKSIQHFCQCIVESKIRSENYDEIIRQAELVDEFFRKSQEDFIVK